MAEGDTELVEVFVTGNDGRPTPDAPSYIIRRQPRSGIVTQIMPAEEAIEQAGGGSANRAVAIPRSELKEGDTDLQRVMNAASRLLSVPDSAEMEVKQEELPIPQHQQVRDMVQGSKRTGSEESKARHERRR